MYKERILKVKQHLIENNIDGFIFFISDDHGSEYITQRYKTVAYLSAFTGSAGTLLITKENAYLWTDGRYFLQAEKQLEKSDCILMKIGQDESLQDFISKNITNLALDFKVANVEFVLNLLKKNKNIKLFDEGSFIDSIWKNRPLLSKSKIYCLDESSYKYSANKKCYKTLKKYKNNNEYGVLVSALDDIAYLLNLRGKDIKYNPVFMSFMFLKKVHGKHEYTLYTSLNKLTDNVKKYLNDQSIIVKPYNKIYKDVSDFNDIIYFDKSKTNYKLFTLMKRKKNSTLYPTLAKAIKNEIEIKDSKKAHELDAIAMIKFIYYVKNNVGKVKMDEISLSNYLAKLRKSQGAYDLSFSTICGYKHHGAIIHYNATPEINIEVYKDGFLLVDSGGQYKCGTTDITRTLALGNIDEKMKFHFTLVLKSHIQLAMARFKKGTLDSKLDLIARKPLWDNNLDYNHGTGHGVGHMLNVHEGPVSIRYNKVKPVSMKQGMITSNEPGLYFENKYGIRHENEMLCINIDKDTLGFEPITYVPFDLDAIDKTMLDESEKKYLNNYHCLVYNKISKYLNDKEKNYLKMITREI